MAPVWPKSDAGAIIQPKPAALGLPRRHPQSFPSPDTRHPLGIHMPTLGTQQCRDPAIAVTPELAGKIDDGLGKRCFVIRHFGNMPLGRPGLTENKAGPTLGNAKRLLNMVHVVPTTLNARSVQGLRSFPTPPPSGSAYQASDRQPPS